MSIFDEIHALAAGSQSRLEKVEATLDGVLNKLRGELGSAESAAAVGARAVKAGVLNIAHAVVSETHVIHDRIEGKLSELVSLL